MQLTQFSEACLFVALPALHIAVPCPVNLERSSEHTLLAGRGATVKSVVFGLLERDGRVYTKVVENVSTETLMTHIRAKTRKGSVYYTDAFKGYQSLKRYGKHHTVNHTKSLVDRRTKNPINGIEGFWSFGKHILYNYRGVSKHHFPMYLKEIECRCNHRRDNLFKLFLQTFFGYVSP